jgi:hypothetical protein
MWGWVGPRAGTDEVRKIWTRSSPGIEPHFSGRPDHNLAAISTVMEIELKHERYCFTGCDAVYRSRSLQTFLRNKLPLLLERKRKRSKEPVRSTQQAERSCLAYSSNLKMEAVRSSETSVKIYRTVRISSQKIVLVVTSVRTSSWTRLNTDSLRCMCTSNRVSTYSYSCREHLFAEMF